MNVINELQILGFNKKQAKVYFALLQLGKATAYRIALNCGLERPTVYVVLEKLREKDAILKIPYPKKQVYFAKPVEELVQNARDKINSLAGILPELKALEAGDNKPKVMFFEDNRGIKQILSHKIEEMAGKEFVGFNAYDEDLSKETEKIVDDYNADLRFYGIRTRGIVPRHPSLRKYRKTDKLYNREMKTVPLKSYNSTISMDAGSDFVRIIAFKELQGVIIENKAMAKSLRQIFEMVWKKIK